MLSIYNANGLVHWTDRDIRLREMMIAHFAGETAAFLTSANPAWDIRRVEAPILTPRELISDAYGPDDVFVQGRRSEHDHDLVLRPETTPSTYAYMQHLLEGLLHLGRTLRQAELAMAVVAFESGGSALFTLRRQRIACHTRGIHLLVQQPGGGKTVEHAVDGDLVDGNTCLGQGRLNLGL